MRFSQMMMEFLDSWQESFFGPNKNSPPAPGTPGYRWLLGLPGLAAHHLGHIEHSTSPFVKKYGLLLEMDAQGEILQSWHSPNGALPKVTTFWLFQGGRKGEPRGPTQFMFAIVVVDGGLRPMRIARYNRQRPCLSRVPCQLKKPSKGPRNSEAR